MMIPSKTLLSTLAAASTTSLLLLWSSGVSADLDHFGDGVLQIHGAGTTNPRNCYWSIMSDMMHQAGYPIRLTYRATDSGVGQAETLHSTETIDGETASATPASAFGSGDIPLSTEQWQSLQDIDVQVMHLPVLIGAVSFFHSVPDAANLKLDKCTLAKIYTGEITAWDHPDIIAQNEFLQDRDDLEDIKVFVRKNKSSSTASITEYLNKACPDVYPLEAVDGLPAWTGLQVAGHCEGSSGMADCLSDEEGDYGIAYIVAGTGWAAGLDEVGIQNRDDLFLTARKAVEANGIATAAENAELPTEATDDFGNVSFIYLPGENQWPITLMTYIYVRTHPEDYVHSLQEAYLLVAFLKALYDPEYVGRCEREYGFFLPTRAIAEFGRSAIRELEMQIDVAVGLAVAAGNATEPIPRPFRFEQTSNSTHGAEELTFSNRRSEIADIEREDLKVTTADLEHRVANLEIDLIEALEEIGRLRGKVIDLERRLNVTDGDMHDVITVITLLHKMYTEMKPAKPLHKYKRT